ncbi:MAG: GNAT family N-acetyltransferase [Pseudomonadota bacterium]
MELVTPTIAKLPDYARALERGWSPDNLRPELATEQLVEISQDANAFVAGLQDNGSRDDEVVLPDGSRVPRLPSMRRWIWDAGFCGTIGLRWQAGTEALPPTCAGHIGYAVVPWRRNQGHASAALIAVLPMARAVGLNHVDLSTDPDNLASIRVMERAGAEFVERFRMSEPLGGREAVRYRIQLTSPGRKG